MPYRAAARVAVAAAREADDPAWIGSTRFVYTLSLPIEAAPTTSRVADRALSALQVNAFDPDVRQMLGQLHLSAALVCAVDRRPDDAAAHLAEASREAESLGDPDDGMGFNVLGFGPTNIGLWRMSVETELGEYGRVIEFPDGYICRDEFNVPLPTSAAPPPQRATYPESPAAGRSWSAPAVVWQRELTKI